MNAFELYDAVFDSARAEFIPATKEEKIQDVMDYAEGAFNTIINRADAENIVAAHEAFNAGEQGSNNFYHLVESPLSEIEL